MSLPATYGAATCGCADIMLAGIYYGATVRAAPPPPILVSLPGRVLLGGHEVIDGYQMARARGGQGPALAAAGYRLFLRRPRWARIDLAAFCIPPLTEVAFKFGPAEVLPL